MICCNTKLDRSINWLKIIKKKKKLNATKKMLTNTKKEQASSAENQVISFN